MAAHVAGASAAGSRPAARACRGEDGGCRRWPPPPPGARRAAAGRRAPGRRRTARTLSTRIPGLQVQGVGGDVVGCPGRLHGHDRLRRDPTGDAPELARVAEALGERSTTPVSEVVVPVVEEVVGAHVGPAVERDERRDPELQAVSQLQQPDAEGRTWSDIATLAAARGLGERGQHRARRAGRDDAHAGRADQTHAVARANSTSLRWPPPRPGRRRRSRWR